MVIAAAALVHLVLGLVIIALWLGVAWLAGSIARRKGRSFAVYFVVALILGPVIGLAVALIAGVLPARRAAPG